MECLISLRNKIITPLQTFIIVLVFCFSVSYSVKPVAAKEKEYLKVYKDSELIFKWNYDFSKKGQTIVRGIAKLSYGAEIEEPVELTITGLDKHNRPLYSKHVRFVELEEEDFHPFVIRVPKNGREKSFLFFYEYEFSVDSSGGPEPMLGWFQDSPDPNVTPKTLTSPPW